MHVRKNRLIDVHIEKINILVGVYIKMRSSYSLAISTLLMCLLLLPMTSFHFSTVKSTRSSTMKMNDKSTTTAVVVTEEEEWSKTFELIKDNLFLPVTFESLLTITSQIEAANPKSREFQILKLSRQNLLTKLLEKDRKIYLETVSQLGNRIPRSELPNRQEIPVFSTNSPPSNIIGLTTTSTAIDGLTTIADCKLPNQTFTDNILDEMLLNLFRNFVQEEIKFVSPQKGILGLLDEGRHFMLSPEGTPENQQRYVRKVLDRLLTPFLPPLYRVVMSGIVPCQENNDPVWLVQLTDKFRSLLPKSWQMEFAPGRQFGPMFYTPILTSAMTTLLIYFLVGPSSINRRKDGQMGGMIVEKCKFLQESGCKGMNGYQ